MKPRVSKSWCMGWAVEFGNTVLYFTAWSEAYGFAYCEASKLKGSEAT